MGRIWIWIFVLIITSSCLKDVEVGQSRIFTISKGKHSSITAIKKYNKSLLRFDFKFDESAKYDLVDIDQFDTNKLIGFKYGIKGQHKNSFRFGWRWDIENQYVVISAYSYVNGSRVWEEIVHEEKKLGNCFIGEICTGEIEETDSEIIYRFQGTEYSVSKSNIKTKQKYYMFPYFGGNEKAPHNITIELWF
jgi:hypothetical protein